MIPNALTSTGAYADMWSHFKSIEHALDRVLDSSASFSLTDLDRERLMALADFLRDNIIVKTPNQSATRLSPTRDSYTAELDLKERLQNVKEFSDWQEKAKLGVNKKVLSLVEAIEGFVKKPSDKLFPQDVPQEAFEVLKAIVAALVSDTESALPV